MRWGKGCPTISRALSEQTELRYIFDKRDNEGGCEVDNDPSFRIPRTSQHTESEGSPVVPRPRRSDSFFSMYSFLCDAEHLAHVHSQTIIVIFNETTHY